MRCYKCKKTVEQEEHEKVDGKFDEFTEMELEMVDQYLDLFHCQGDEDLFDKDGFVVICDECLKEAINYYKEMKEEEDE